MDVDNLVYAHRLLLTSSLLQFTTKMFEYMNKSKYIIGYHHRIICDAIDKSFKGEEKYKHLIINIAPRYGKTLLVSRMAIAYGLAINPKSKFLHLSYSGQLTMENSVAIKDIVNNDYYRSIFDARVKYGSDTKSKWNTIQGGCVYATSTLGQITGFGAGLVDSELEDEETKLYNSIYNKGNFGGAIIIDDPIRPEDALSELVREKVNRRFETTIRNRVNSRNTPIIIIMQRLHENDLCGYLENTEPNSWKVISLPAIIEDEKGNEKALWEFKHTLEELKQLKEINSWVFDTQYMQDPKPIVGLLFPEQKTKYFEGVPDNPEYIHIQCDPADEGVDYTASVVYYVIGQQVYVVDVIFTQDSSEITIPRVVKQIADWGASTAVIESNSSWSLFRKEIKNRCAELGLATNVRATTARENKEIRIFNHAPSIIDRFHYKRNADGEYARYLKYRHSYLKMVKDQKDDGVDCDTSACQYFKRNGLIPII